MFSISYKLKKYRFYLLVRQNVGAVRKLNTEKRGEKRRDKPIERPEGVVKIKHY